jgi:glycerol dehydrogenase
MPFPITVDDVAAAIITADKIGKEYKMKKMSK